MDCRYRYLWTPAQVICKDCRCSYLWIPTQASCKDCRCSYLWIPAQASYRYLWIPVGPAAWIADAGIYEYQHRPTAGFADAGIYEYQHSPAAWIADAGIYEYQHSPTAWIADAGIYEYSTSTGQLHGLQMQLSLQICQSLPIRDWNSNTVWQVIGNNYVVCNLYIYLIFFI